MAELILVAEFDDRVQNSTGFLVAELVTYLEKKHSVRVVTPSALSNLPIFKLIKSRLLKKVLIGLHLIFVVRRYASSESHIIVTTNPFLNWFTSRFFGAYKSRALLVFDIFPESLATQGSTRMSNFLIRLRRLFLPRFDYYFALTSDMCQYIRDEICNAYNAQIYRTPIWIKPDSSGPNHVVNMAWSRDDRMRLVYFGNLGALTDFDGLSTAFSIAQGYADIDIFGSGAKESEVERVFAEVARVGGHVDFADRGRTLSQYHGSLVIQPPSLKKFAVPSKAFFSWESGCRVLLIADRTSELYETIANNSALGVAIDYDAPVSVKRIGVERFFNSFNTKTPPMIHAELEAFLNANREAALKVFTDVYQ